MNDRELLDEVRRLRAGGASPREIARILGVRPAMIAPLVRHVAAERTPPPRGAGALAGCWVSPGWSRELLVVPREGWDDVDLGADGPAGVALVLVARTARHDSVTTCGFLLDTFCLGVKNVIGPKAMRRRDLDAFAGMYFQAFPKAGLAAPVELAQHLVHGSVAFARTLGFSPHREFEGAREHLGDLEEPYAITFGRRGRPLYVAGPFDDPIMIMETLVTTVGSEGFAVAA